MTGGAGLIALVTLILGWILDWAPARSVVANWPTMKPLAALMVLGVAAGLWPGWRRNSRPLVMTLGVAALASVSIVGSFVEPARPAQPWLELPSVATALSLLLLAFAAAFLVAGRSRRWIVAALALVGLGLSIQRLLILALTGLALGQGIFGSMSILSAASVALLAMGMLLDPRMPLAGLLAARTPAGRAARRGVVFMIIGVTLVLVTSLVVAAAARQRHSAVPLEDLLAVSTVALILSLGALLGALVASLQRGDELAKQERLLRAVTDHLPGMVGYWDHDLVCRFANPAYLEWFGRLPEDVVGRHMQDLLGDELFRRNEVFIHGALRGEPQRFERTLVKPGGEVGHTWAQYIPDAVGEDVKGFAVLVTDVTELRRREVELEAYRTRLEEIVTTRTTALRESEARFRQVAHSLPQLVWTCTPTGECDFLSDQWVAYTGVPAELQLRTSWLGLVHHDDIASLTTRWAESVATGAPLQVEFRLRRHDGVFRWFDTRAVALRDEVDTVVKWFGTNTDIEDRKALEDQLRRHTAELERSNASLEQYAWVASHDLQEPLRMVGSFTQLLARRYSERLDDQGRVMMGHVTAGAQRMQSLVDGMLRYARLGGRRAVESGIDMSDAARRALELLTETVHQTGAQVRIDDDMPRAPLDEAEAKQLWLNLLGNALKYRGAATPQVHVGVRLGPAGTKTFFVADNGPGIAPSHHERVFQMFQRLEVDPSRRHQGTGIGLALCRRVVEVAGGRIWIESDGSTGSTFCFTLPPYEGGRR